MKRKKKQTYYKRITKAYRRSQERKHKVPAGSLKPFYTTWEGKQRVAGGYTQNVVANDLEPSRRYLQAAMMRAKRSHTPKGSQYDLLASFHYEAWFGNPDDSDGREASPVKNRTHPYAQVMNPSQQITKIQSARSIELMLKEAAKLARKGYKIVDIYWHFV